MVSFEFAQAYIDDLLCITKASLDDYLDKLKMVLTRSQDTGLQITNQYPQFSFCAIDMNTYGISSHA